MEPFSIGIFKIIPDPIGNNAVSILNEYKQLIKSLSDIIRQKLKHQSFADAEKTLNF